MTFAAGGRRDGRLIAALALLVVILFFVSLGVGPVWLSPGTVARALVGDGGEAARIIVIDIRLPRALLAVMIGGTLGLAGAALQGLLRRARFRTVQTLTSAALFLKRHCRHGLYLPDFLPL